MLLIKRKATVICKNLAISYVKASSFSLCSSIKSGLGSAGGRTTSKFLVYCNSQITRNGRNGNIKEAESVFNRMPHKNVISWTALLTAYAQNGKIAKAREVFDKMPERTASSYNAMITAYIRNGSMVDEANELFRKMPDRNGVSYAAMITGFAQAGRFDEAQEVYSNMPVKLRDPVCSNAMISGYLKVGRLDDAVRIFKGMMERDVVSWSSMLDGYCKSGRVLHARDLFERMPERNFITWTAMINGYMKIGYLVDGFHLFSSMRREEVVMVNSTTLTVMVEACGDSKRYHEGIQMHGLVLCMGFDFDVFLGNSMINMYCKLDCVDAATTIFDMVNNKDLVSWNSLIAGYAQHNQIEKAYELFEMMPRKDVVSWTTMIAGFSSLGNSNKSIELFRTMPKKDSVAWTAVISGFVSNEEYEDAFRWFVEMQQEAVKPNSLTLSSVLSASASLASLNQGMQIHAQVVKMHLELDLSIQNSLISMYSKCGNVPEAYRIFMSINEPNVVSFNSMITSLAQNGYEEEAVRLFMKMQREGQEPNETTFLAVLSACNHGGLVDVGREYFKSMKSLYGIEPGPDHYACMVDLLGRAGLLDEAIEFIHSMPFEPHCGVWGALLSASKTHLRLDLAKLAAKNLTELNPDSVTPYVVLSSLCSTMGVVDGHRLRMITKSKGMRKSPGCSWLILKDRVHLFLVGDRSCKDFEEIKVTLQILVKEMQGSGCYR